MSRIIHFLFNPNRSLEKYAFFLSYFCYFYSKNQALNNITSFEDMAGYDGTRTT